MLSAVNSVQANCNSINFQGGLYKGFSKPMPRDRFERGFYIEPTKFEKFVRCLLRKFGIY